MITISLMGGCGNQLFQYALGRSLEQNDEVQFSTRHFEQDSVRFYMLDQLGLDLPLVNAVNTPLFREASLRFNPEVLKMKNACLMGYWQCEKYFDRVKPKILRKVFGKNFWYSHDTLKIADSIPENSAFIHVRRSDTLSNRSINFHGLIGLDYYNAAADYIRLKSPGVQFFVFSDDHKWIRENMTASDMTIVDCNSMSGEVQPDNEVKKVFGGREVEDLYLMSLCKHAVISNSSFSWWGAWLGEQEDSIVTCPRRWFVTDKVDSTDICPDRWVRL